MVRGNLEIKTIRMQWQLQIKEDITVGHVPRALLPICSIFIRTGGIIICLITRGRQYSSDLPQGVYHVLIFGYGNLKGNSVLLVTSFLHSELT